MRPTQSLREVIGQQEHSLVLDSVIVKLSLKASLTRPVHVLISVWLPLRTSIYYSILNLVDPSR